MYFSIDFHELFFKVATDFSNLKESHCTARLSRRWWNKQPKTENIMSLRVLSPVLEWGKSLYLFFRQILINNARTFETALELNRCIIYILHPSPFLVYSRSLSHTLWEIFWPTAHCFVTWKLLVISRSIYRQTSYLIMYFLQDQESNPLIFQLVFQYSFQVRTISTTCHHPFTSLLL